MACSIQYGWIVKLETINEDVVPIVKNLYECIYNNTGLHNIHLKLLQELSEELSNHYSTALQDCRKDFSAKTENITYSKYRDDFEAFGYHRQKH